MAEFLNGPVLVVALDKCGHGRSYSLDIPIYGGQLLARKVGLEWATFPVMRRTRASISRKAGVDFRVSLSRHVRTPQFRC
jgi:hypothetical protein